MFVFWTVMAALGLVWTAGFVLVGLWVLAVWTVQGHRYRRLHKETQRELAHWLEDFGRQPGEGGEPGTPRDP
jgi:Flp pilus assembly protein TadB